MRLIVRILRWGIAGVSVLLLALVLLGWEKGRRAGEYRAVIREETTAQRWGTWELGVDYGGGEVGVHGSRQWADGKAAIGVGGVEGVWWGRQQVPYGPSGVRGRYTEWIGRWRKAGRETHWADVWERGGFMAGQAGAKDWAWAKAGRPNVPGAQRRYWWVVVPCWAAALVLALVPAMEAWATVRWARRVRAARRVKQGRCGGCGYDLRGTPERCPECGRERGVLS